MKKQGIEETEVKPKAVARKKKVLEPAVLAEAAVAPQVELKAKPVKKAAAKTKSVEAAVVAPEMVEAPKVVKAAKKAVAEKAVVKKAATKKTAVKKAVAKKVAAKKVVARKDKGRDLVVDEPGAAEVAEVLGGPEADEDADENDVPVAAVPVAPVPGEPEPKLERLQKILAKAGISSRRKAEELILGGRVQINGQVVLALGTKADPSRDHVRVDGKLLQGAERIRYFVLNKPKGYVTTVSDPEGRPTVMQFFLGERERLYPVGRLDYLSEGLLLVTNDGELANKLTKASSGVEKTYLVKVAGQPTEDMLDVLRAGVVIERGRPGTNSGRVRTAPAKIRQVRQGDNPWYEVIVIEGRNRELRKMFEEIGHHVEKIRRIGYGPLILDLEPGKQRELEAEEVQLLRLASEGKLKTRRRRGPAPAQLPTVAGKTVRYKKADGRPGFEKPSRERAALPEAGREFKPPVRTSARPAVRPEFETNSKPEFPKKDFRAGARPAFKTEFKPGFKSAAKPYAKQEFKAEFKPESKPGFKTDFKPAGRPGFGGRSDFAGKPRRAEPPVTEYVLPPRKAGPPEPESDFNPDYKPGFRTGGKPGSKPAFRTDRILDRTSDRPAGRAGKPFGTGKPFRPERPAEEDDFVPTKTPGFRIEPVVEKPREDRPRSGGFARPAAGARPFRPAGGRPAGGDRPFQPRPGRSDAPASGGRPFRPRKDEGSGRDSRSFTERPSGPINSPEGRPAGRPAGPSAGGKPFRPSSSGYRPSTGRPGAGRPGPGRPSSGRTGTAGSGPSRSGSVRPQRFDSRGDARNDSRNDTRSDGPPRRPKTFDAGGDAPREFRPRAAKRFDGPKPAPGGSNSKPSGKVGPDGLPRVKVRHRDSFTGKNKGRPKPKSRRDE